MGKKGTVSLEELVEQALVKEDEKSYEVPENWVWVNLKSIILPMTTAKPDVNKEYFQYIDIDAIDNKMQVINEPKCIKTSEAPSRASKELRYGNTLFSMVRPYLRNIAYIYKEYEECIGSTGFYVCKPSKGINSRFLFHLLCSEYIITKATSMMRGDNSPSIRNSEFEEIALPLPPITEQQRIVTIIESLFEKLDRAKELAQNALDSFEKRKSVLLGRAIRGDLTIQWRIDNPAFNSRHELENIKGNKNYKSDKNETIEFSIPVTWNWAELGCLIGLLTDYHANGSYEILKKNVELLETLDYACMIRTTNFEKNNFETLMKYISKEAYDFLNKSKIFGNEILINKIGNAGSIYLMPNLNRPASLAMNLFMIRLSDGILPKYIYYHLKTLFSEKDIKQFVKGVATKSIDKKSINSLKIAFPPLKEQQEIVRILDRLLENEQKAKELCSVIDKIDHIKKSILAKAFRGELGTNHPEEESALELLKEVLQEKSK